MKKTSSLPVLQALVIADRIYTDHPTGKRIICATFSKIFSREFPSVTSFSAFAFILLVDVIGEFVLQLRFVSLHDNQILMESKPMRIQSNDPLTPLDIVVQIPPFPLPRAGIYSFECWTDETMIGSVRIQVGKLPSKKDSND